MTLENKKPAALAVLILLFMPMVHAKSHSLKTFPQRPESMSVWEARRIIAAQPKDAFWDNLQVDRSSYHFTATSFDFEALSSKGSEHFEVDLRSIGQIDLNCWVPKTGELTSCFAGAFVIAPMDKDRSKKTRRVWIRFAMNGACSAECAHVAQSFVAAVNRLRAFAARDEETSLPPFAQQAAAWRAMSAKPPIPEDVRVQRLLAEDAVKQKNPSEALSRYETGLELYPTWPQGYFNAALIAAELGYYADALEHMQAYLELVPDAPDAQSVRDQIAIWQYKAKENK